MWKRIAMQTIFSSFYVVTAQTVLLIDIANVHAQNSPEQQFDALMKNYNAKLKDLGKARQRILLRMNRAKTIAERSKLNREFRNLLLNSPVTQLTPKFVKFAFANSKSESGLKAMAWVIKNNPRQKNIARFMNSILKYHAKSKNVAEVLPAMQRTLKTLPVDFLRTVIDDNPWPQAKATASVILAGQFKNAAETQGDMKQYRKAVSLFEKTSKKYGSFPSPRGVTIFDFCRSELEEINGPRGLGKTVPEIKGEDLDGNPFKLSQTRGKVVVLDFWADWQPRCREMYAQKNKLVKRLANKPFVLIGMNSDRNYDRLKQTVKKKNIAWRTLWSGGTRGPIVKAWNIHRWPTIYVIDAKGIIRYKNVQGKALDEAVQKLLAETPEGNTKG